MNRKSVSSAGTTGLAAASEPLLGFAVWITPFRGVTPAQLATFERRLEDYLSERDLQGSGAPLQMLIWADDRSLSATDQVDLLVWLIGQIGATTVEIGPLQSHCGMPSERGSLPVVLAQFGDLCLVPIAWLYNASRLKPDQVIEMLGGYRATATLH